MSAAVRWRRTLWTSVAELGALLLAHALLLRYMVTHDVASAILSAGKHLPPLTLALAGLFLLVRFLAVLALPGMLLARIGLVLFDAWQARDEEKG